ncbi:MAG TPA: cytochrome c oxidase subunit 3 [Bryobacteraceae bacterium]|nr:cytochrome c oxidase subunit 3 [Bryobacteraceae bacterium]
MPGFPSRPFTGTANKFQFGMMVSLLSIGMFFAALTTAFVIIIPRQPVQFRVAMPDIMWLSTALITASSVGFERARWLLRRARLEQYRRALMMTLVLGALFILCQTIAWERLVVQGVGFESNARGSAFYILTGVHALHLFGGMMGLVYVRRKSLGTDDCSEQSLRGQRRRNGAATLYWHSMGLLWFVLFTLLLGWSS